MDYSMIGKIEKAKLYAEQRDRIHFDTFQVRINGDNNPHVVSYDQGAWHCDCDYFATRTVCSHTMTMERVLDSMVEIG
jgi:hypothetical protein